MEILTVADVAAWLKISKSQVYELAKERTRTGDVRENPIPSLRLGASIRFRKSAIESWLDELAKK